jgi:predicted DNA-binding protein
MKVRKAIKKDASLGIRLPSEDLDRLVAEAKRMDRDKSDYAWKLIKDGLAQVEQERYQAQMRGGAQ